MEIPAEVPSMPNRTIYVADADLPIFERAQQLAGGNLSSTIVSALKYYVDYEESKARGYEEVTVKVGKMVHTQKRFWGRLLAKGRIRSGDDTRDLTYNVYQTPKNNFAVYIKDSPNWDYWSHPKRRSGESRRGVRERGTSQTNEWSYRDWANNDWAQWPRNEYDFRLEVYETEEGLKDNVPPELYEAVTQSLRGGPDGVEFLDI